MKIMEAVDTQDAGLLDELTSTYKDSTLDFQFHGSIYRGIRKTVTSLSLIADSPLTRAVSKSNYNITEQLVRAGTNVNFKDTNGSTPLLIAASQENFDMCQLLLKYGANIHATDPRDEFSYWTALHWAVASGHNAMVILFLEHGALQFNTQEQVNTWLDPLDGNMQLIFKSPHIMELLLNDLENQGWKIPLELVFEFAISSREDCCIALLQRGFYPVCEHDRQNIENRHFFYSAALEGLIRLMKLLIMLNPKYLQDEWLVENEIPVDLSQHTGFVSWLLQHRSHPAQLTHLCRAEILEQLGQNYLTKIEALPLPKLLKAFLGVVKSDRECAL